MTKDGPITAYLLMRAHHNGRSLISNYLDLMVLSLSSEISQKDYDD
jgi:hypothetical protein